MRDGEAKGQGEVLKATKTESMAEITSVIVREADSPRNKHSVADLGAHLSARATMARDTVTKCGEAKAGCGDLLGCSNGLHKEKVNGLGKRNLA